jgi:hypothetical protein
MTDVAIKCPCPGTPHEGDTVTLADKLSLRAGAAMQYLIATAGSTDRRSQADTAGILSEAYLLYGITGWTLVDAKAKPIEVSQEAIAEHLLSDYSIAQPIAEVADDLYQDTVIAPLVRRASRQSPPTPTEGSTSVPPTTLRQRRSKRSSITTSPTAATAQTSPSPNGDSSLSRSLELVGG